MELEKLVQQTSSVFNLDMYFQEERNIVIFDRSETGRYPNCVLEKDSDGHRKFRKWLSVNADNWYESTGGRNSHMFVEGFSHRVHIFPYVIIIDARNEREWYWAHDITLDI